MSPEKKSRFQFKQKETSKTENNGKKNVNIMVSLKYLSKFCRTLEILLINCEINLILTWCANFVLSDTNAN